MILLVAALTLPVAALSCVTAAPVAELLGQRARYVPHEVDREDLCHLRGRDTAWQSLQDVGVRQCWVSALL